MLGYLQEYFGQGFTIYLPLITDVDGNAASPTLADGDITVRFGEGGTDLTNVASHSSPEDPTEFVASYVSGMDGMVKMVFSDAQVSDLLMFVKAEDQDGPAFLTVSFPFLLQPNQTKWDGNYLRGYEDDGSSVLRHQVLEKSGGVTTKGPIIPGDVP